MTKRWRRLAVLLAAAAAGPLSASAATYSNASLKGVYSVLGVLRTANAATTQTATLGLVTFDGAGNASASLSSVALGAVTTGAYAGTYAVNANGTGLLTLTGGPTLALTLDSLSGAVAGTVEILDVSDSANEIGAGQAVLQTAAAHVYGVKSIKGTFFFTAASFPADPSLSQAAAIGVDTFDGKGGFTATFANVTNGVYTQVTVPGVYTINADGTGTATLLGGYNTRYITVLNTAPGAAAKGFQAVIVGDPNNEVETITGRQ
jgi:hypothetical protein